MSWVNEVRSSQQDLGLALGPSGSPRPRLPSVGFLQSPPSFDNFSFPSLHTQRHPQTAPNFQLRNLTPLQPGHLHSQAANLQSMQGGANHGLGVSSISDYPQINPTGMHPDRSSITSQGRHFEIIEADAQPDPNGRRTITNEDDSKTVSSRQPSSRKPRTRQPGETQWQKNKKNIEKLYMKDDLPLSEVVRLMEKDHGFSASERMYKNKFKAWHWSKNLPREKAMWMNEKIKQRRPAATVFYWNHQEWPEDKIMQTYGGISETEQQRASPAAYAGTPDDMKNIDYWTPLPASETPQTLQNVANEQARHPENLECNRQKFYLDDPPVNLDLTQMTISDLRKLVDSAARLASDGKLNEADADFRDAVAGFRQLLSPTHEETIKAAYLYASFYANSGEMNKADAVLSWMSEMHRKKWGSQHEKTWLNYARIVELFNSWGRKAQAETLVYKLLEELDAMDNEMGLDFADFAGPQRRHRLGVTDDLTQNFPETDDLDSIRHQLNKMDLAVMTHITGLDDVLQTIIRHCDEGGSEDHYLQACRARCTLAKHKMSSGQTGDGLKVLESAKTSLGRILDVSMEPLAHSTVKIAHRLAFMLFEANNEPSCKDVIDEVIAVLEARLSLPDCVGGDIEKYALIDFVLSTAFYFHEKSSWQSCRYWVERALVLSVRHFGRQSPLARKLQIILQQEDFEMRSSATLSNLMGFSSGRLIVNLAR